MSRTLALLAGVAALALVGPALAETIAITNAKIETVGSAGEIASGTLVIKDGKIAAVGAGVTAPAGARVIDAKGQVLTPGLIAASSNLTVAEVDGLRETRDDAGGSELGAAFDIQYGVNPASTLVPLARQTGITRAVVTPIGGRSFEGDADETDTSDLTAGAPSNRSAGASLFDGMAAGVTLGAGDVEPVFKPRMAMVVDLGEGGGRVAGSRAAAFVLFRSSLEDARRYTRNKAMFDRGAEVPYKLAREDLEALQAVVDGSMPLLIRIHRAADMRQMLKIAREEHLRMVFEGAEEGWLVASELAAAHVPVLIDTEADLPDSFDQLGSRLDNATRLQAAGVLVAIQGSRDFDNLREARLNAGTAVANGMPYQAALAAVTLNPAKTWGFADQVGSLEVGKAADVVMWNGDPLETTSYPTAVFIGGHEQPMTSRGLKLRDRYAGPDGPYPRQYH